MVRPFQPTFNTSISTSTTSARARLSTGVNDASGIDGNPVKRLSAGKQVRIVSVTVAHYIKFGRADVVATSSDLYIPAGQTEVFSIGDDDNTHVAALATSSTGTVYISQGDGE